MASKANTSLSSEITTARLLAEEIKNRADSVAKVGLTTFFLQAGGELL
ncbi:hypothetical protein [Treponema zioleckii]|nr:hypothetical protein [Treponema zioleckii]